MKKIGLLICIFSIFLTGLFAQNTTGEKVMIIPILENINDTDEDSFLGGFVRDRVQANLDSYTDFAFVNSANKKEIIELQMESESDIYDESTAIELGKLVNADYGLFITIRRVEQSYIVQAKFTDIESGLDLFTTDTVSRLEPLELASSNGCAADELSLLILDKLEIELTQTERHLLMNGKSGLNGEEEYEAYLKDEEKYQELLVQIQNDIDVLSNSSEVEDVVRQENLEAEKKQAMEKLKWVREKKLKLKEEQQRREDEEELDAKRSDELRNMLKETSEALTEKLGTINYSEQESFISRIKYVETIKKAFYEIKEDADLHINTILEDVEEQVDIKREEVNSRPLKAHEVSTDGYITYTAQENRDREVEDFAEGLYKKANIRVSNIEKIADAQQKKLLREIEKGYAGFKKVTITTFGDELIVDIGEYDGKKYGWDLIVTVQSDDIKVLTTKAFLPYSSLTGHKEAPSSEDPNYERYTQEVEYYSSLFTRNEPVLTFALDIIIEPLPKDRPSCYNFYFENFRYYETLKFNTKGKTITSLPKDKLALRNSYIEHQMTPAYDIRTKADFEREEREIAEIEEREAKEEAKRAKEMKERKLKEYEKEKKQEEKEEAKRNRVYTRDFFAINYNLMTNEKTNRAVGIEFSKGIIEWLYFDYKIDLYNIMHLPSTYYPVTDEKFNPMLANFAQLGINFHLGSMLQIFGSGGVGFNVSFPSSIFTDIPKADDKIGYFGRNCKADWTYGYNVGASFELIRHVALTASFNQTYFFV